MELKESFLKLFTDDPVNWIKWLVVFAVLVIGYVAAIPLYSKVSYRFSWDRKRDIAKSRGHVIEASLLQKYPSGKIGNYDWHATYLYTIHGEEKKYRAFFNCPNTPPRILYLYYIDSPKKVFSVSEYHWQNHIGCLLILIMFLPWLLAAFTIMALKIDISGF